MGGRGRRRQLEPGKTTTLRCARETWEQAGCRTRVRGRVDRYSEMREAGIANAGPFSSCSYQPTSLQLLAPRLESSPVIYNMLGPDPRTNPELGFPGEEALAPSSSIAPATGYTTKPRRWASTRSAATQAERARARRCLERVQRQFGSDRVLNDWRLRHIGSADRHPV